MSELGNIKIADDVVKVVASKAASDVKGVYKLAGGVADEVNKILGKKRLTHGVKVEVGDVECSIEAHIVVEYGYPIPDVATEVQESIVKAITDLTGLKVVEVNVYVQDVKILDEADKDDEEIEILD